MTRRTGRTGPLPRAVAVICLLGAAAACTSNIAADRSGGQVVRLSFATIDGDVNSDPWVGPGTFVDQLEKVSAGRLRVDVSTSYGDGDAESRLLRAIAAGQVDGGWPATRAFANAGIDGLRAVEAPMTVTNYAAERDLVQGPASAIALKRLDDTGVVGLGLMVGPLRRPFAAKAPLLEPADWRDVRFRVYHSPVEADTVRHLGGVPVDVGYLWVDRIRAGTLQGGDLDVAGYASNGFGTAAGNLPANVVLWPKVGVLTLNRARFNALTEQQQQWLRTAGSRAVRTSLRISFDESAAAQDLCAQGVRIVNATDDQLRALRSAVAPVIDQLADDPVEAPLLDAVQAVAARHPQPETLSVPSSCRQAGGAPATPAIPHRDSSLPNGTYRVAIPAGDVVAAGVSNSSGWSGTWTLQVKDGGYTLSCRPLGNPGRDCGNTVSANALEAGWLRGQKHLAHFVSDPQRLSRLNGCELPASGAGDNYCVPLAPYTARWRLDGRALTFTAISGAQTPAHLTLEPWERIG